MSEIVLLSDSEDPGGPSAAAAQSSPLWRCPQCSYAENPATYLVCGMCCTDRPDGTTSAAPQKPPPPPPPPSTTTAAVDLTGDDDPGAGPSKPSPTAWACPACTLVNSGGLKVCEACGTPPLGAELSKPPPPPPQQQQPSRRKSITTSACQPESQQHQQPGVYSLDCGCCFPRADAAAAVRAAAARASSAALPALLAAFACPAGCGRQLSRRDLEALLGSAAAADKVDRRFYRAAKKEAHQSVDSIDLTESPDLVTSHCVSIAHAVAELHAAVASSAAGSSVVAAAAAAAVSPPGRQRGGKKGKKRARSNTHDAYGRRDDSRAGGVGFGGGGGADDGAVRRQLEAAAAARQDAADESIAVALRRFRNSLEALLADESAGALAQRCPSGWLPLGAVAALQGGPLAPCLRLLLCNDSLMDVTARQEVYNEALRAAQALAQRQELVPLLLRPADGDVLARFSVDGDEEEEDSEDEEEGELRAKRARRDGGTAAPLTEDSSCWRALQAFRVQCDLFMRSAEALAEGGSEGDVDAVGTVLLVRETASTIEEAVTAWKAATAAAVASAAPHHHTSDYGAALSDPEKRQRYAETMRPLAFKTIDLVGGNSDYYFRSQLNAAPTGDVSARLRRLTKEVSTLPNQLPIDWDSSILVACDEYRLDALRAVIIAPPGTPYENGPFFFDIFLPPDYPASPPKVQFMTTGGGRIRFNPNLYNNGKVCLSLLGTWAGPGWQPGTSTLLQVLVSIQAMILGEPEPYGNEPGFANTLKTPAGQRESQKYNAQQRANTANAALLPALRGTAPRGFEDALEAHFRLKAVDLKVQMGEWVRLDGEEEGRERAEAARAGRGGRGGRGGGAMFNMQFGGQQGGPANAASRGMRRAAEQVCAALDALPVLL